MMMIWSSLVNRKKSLSVVARRLYDGLYSEGYVILPGFLYSPFLEAVAVCLDSEWSRRIEEGESEEDIKAREQRGHYMASHEHSPIMDLLANEIRGAINSICPENWIEANRQIVWRTQPGKSPIDNHLDGLGKVLDEKLEDQWPGFDLLAGVNFGEVSRRGQGGLLVRKGSHQQVRYIYRKVSRYSGGNDALKEIKKFVDGSDSDEGTLLKMKPGDLALIHPLTVHRPDDLDPGTEDRKAYLRLKTTEVVGPKAFEKVILF